MKAIARTAILVGASCLTMFADAIPYQNSGSIAPTNTFTATTTGNILAYFDGSDAMDEDTITLLVNGVQKGTGVDNQTSILGDSFNLGSVNAGDVLVFVRNNMATGQQFSSNPANSQDGVNHVYATSFSGDPMNGIPAGTYLGFEDMGATGGDLDYNDDSLVLTNVTAASPRTTSGPVALATNAEPSSLVLLGGCLLALAMFLRVRSRVRG